MIPYGTAAEAEAALGRGMTWAEAAWFRYSAGIPDYWLLWHNTLVLFLIHALVPLPLALLEHLAPAVVMPYKLQPQVRHSPATVARYIKKTVFVFIQVVAPYQLVSYPIVKLAGIRMGLPLPSAGEIMAQLVVYSLVEDYLFYWLHRLLHTRWGYTKIHHVHHEVTTPIGFTSSYSHWAEVIIFSIPTFVGPAIVPCHVTTHWLWLAVLLVEAIDAHSGYDFPFSPTKFIPFYGGAQFHDFHHCSGGQSKSNFGSFFTYCDSIYGTNKGYRYYRESQDKLKSTKLAENNMEKAGSNGLMSEKEH
ncbi:hypothetical protein ACP4OV_030808 [Aristida adscensionis]